ncbi:MAG: hypothetical protein PHN31_07000, partial [Candidatus Gracilibacteria bacterium]|nr:hypothetical protein [Candidatus Gracilibacteria bacterium]
MKIEQLYKKVKMLGKNNFFTVNIKGTEKNVKAMAEYITKNGLQYIKIVFTDKSFLYIPKNEETLYYSENYITDTNIKDKDIGVKEKINFNSKDYYLENKDDYQFVKKFYLGEIGAIEGEVRFSDYVPKEGDDILSLGWTSIDNKRCDLNPFVLDVSY